MRAIEAIREDKRVQIVMRGEDGCFGYVRADRETLRFIASWGGGWDHVSVSGKKRVPRYAEMETIASIFFADDETAMQLRVPKVDHVNTHPYCLHWWRPQDVVIPRPPALFV